MIDAFGYPQSVLLWGGTSEIGLAIVDEWVSHRTTRVVLAGRNASTLEAAAQRLHRNGCQTSVVIFDAADPSTHAQACDEAFAEGDIDAVVLAFGILGDQHRSEAEPSLAVEVAQVNYVGGVSIGLLSANQLRRQGHGLLVVLSSVAGERARRSNFVYGSTKSGLDAFAQGLGDSLRGSGAAVMVVRPGFVHTSMTQGLKAAPMSTDAATVAHAVVAAVADGKEVVWVPGKLRFVMSTLRHLPRSVFRRLPL